MHVDISYRSATGMVTERVFEDDKRYTTRRLGVQTMEWFWNYVAGLRAQGIHVTVLIDGSYTDA